MKQAQALLIDCKPEWDAQLPKVTRRILFCNGMDKPASAKNDSIFYNGDMLLDGDKLHENALDAHKKGEKSLLETVVERGYVSPSEMAQRGKTIELENGSRECTAVSQERKADERYHPYDDKEYIQNAKNREQEK